MTLDQAISEGRRLAVAVMRDHERQAAEIYIVDGGVVFLDVGWSEPLPPMPRAHYMAGEIEGEGPWRVGSWTIREVDPETDPEYLEEWGRWLAFQTETGATRTAGAAYASEFLELEVRA